MSNASHIDVKLSQYCTSILSCEVDNWEQRNKLILAMTDLMKGVERGDKNYESLWKPSLFKQLKEPIKSLISDLRSQQVRDTCLFLVQLAVSGGDHLRLLWKDVFRDVLKAVQMPNRVMAGMVDDCIMEIIRYSTFKAGIGMLVSEYKESRSKGYREHCLKYINEILINWEIVDKEADVICDVIRLGLEDASCGSREIARLAYINLYTLFPKKAEKLKQSMPSSQLKNRLIKAEMEAQQLKQQASVGADYAAVEYAKGSIPSSKYDGTKDQYPALLSEKSLIGVGGGVAGGGGAGNLLSSEATSSFKHLPAKTLGKRLDKGDKEDKRMSFHMNRIDPRDKAATCIQAIFRGMLTRKLLPEVIEAFRESCMLSYNDSNSNNYDNGNSNYYYNNNGYHEADLNQMNSEFISSDSASSLSFKIGDIVAVPAMGHDVLAKVKFVGYPAFAEGLWIGIQFDSPIGKNNGSVNDRRYFICLDQHGLFVRPHQIQHISGFDGNTFTDTSAATSVEGARDVYDISKIASLIDITKVKVFQSMELLKRQLSKVEELDALVLSQSAFSDSSNNTSTDNNNSNNVSSNINRASDIEYNISDVVSKLNELNGIYDQELMLVTMSIREMKQRL